MEIRQLTSADKIILKELFDTSRYMGTDVESKYFVSTENKFSQVYYDIFCDTYLSDLKSYKAFGCIENGTITCLISFYESIDEPSWYGTQIRSIDKKSIPAVLDACIKHNEENGRLKFYSLFNKKYAKSFRRLAFSKYNSERYGSFDEFIVKEKTKCIYALPWQILYSRTLLPVDSLLRCSFLKQEYRTNLPIAGNI